MKELEGEFEGVFAILPKLLEKVEQPVVPPPRELIPVDYRKYLRRKDSRIYIPDLRHYILNKLNNARSILQVLEDEVQEPLKTQITEMDRELGDFFQILLKILDKAESRGPK
jgi:hypothetical protein